MVTKNTFDVAVEADADDLVGDKITATDFAAAKSAGYPAFQFIIDVYDVDGDKFVTLDEFILVQTYIYNFTVCSALVDS